MRHLFLSFLISFICINIQAQCPSEDIIFGTQQEIDSFAVMYPACTQIEGNLEIGMFGIYSDIHDLEALDQINSIEGDLRITSNDNLANLNGLNNLTSIGAALNISDNALTDLSGLEALTSIGSDLRVQDNAVLTSLNGLNNLNTVGGNFSFSNNNALNNLNGLQQLNSVGGELRLFSNNALADMSGLEGLNAVDGNFIIQFNPTITSLNGLNNINTIGGNLILQFNAALTTLAALNNLTAIGGYLDIDNNATLTALTGLDNIDHTSISDLRLFNNFNLSVCGVPSICSYLEGMGTYEISNNAAGCNTAGETGCLVSTTVPEFTSFSIFPVPARRQIHLQFEEDISTAEISILNISGSVMYRQIVHTPGSTPLTFEVSAYPPGVYFLSINNGEQLMTKRFMKQ